MSLTDPSRLNFVLARAVTSLTFVIVLLTACGGGGGGGGGGSAVTTPPPTSTYTIGGSMSGLTGSGLVLQDNAGDNLNVASKAASFTFTTAVASGAKYAVTVLTQPTNPSQTCTVSNGSGTATGADVTTVGIACTVNLYTVGGSISGLTGTGLELQDNAGDNLTVAPKAANFTFPTGIASGGAYTVTVKTQPATPAQVCSVVNGTGSVGATDISNVAVSCVSVAKFVYVANSSDGANGTGDVSAFTVNANTGALTAVAGGPVAADLNPSAIAVDPSGQFAYVSNGNSADVSIFIVDPVAGALTLKGNAYTPGTSEEAIAVAPSDQFLFVAGFGNPAGAVDTFTLNPDSGSLTVVPSSPYPAGNTPYGLAVDPTSKFVFATTAFTHFLFSYTIGSDGSLTQVAGDPFIAGAGSYGVVTYPLGGATGGFVYTANSAANTVSAFSYDKTGNLTELTQQGSPYGVGSQPKGIAIDAAGKFLYVANDGDGTVSSFSINAQSGALNPVGTPVATGNLTKVPNPGPVDVKVDPTGRFVYVANNLDGSVSLFTASAGVLTLSATYPTGAGAIGVAID